jgi:ribose transport system substrate-binding protein
MYSTDYTANQAFQVAQNVIQANKKLDAIFSNYSGMSVGVVKARQAAKRDDVKIYDFGGDQWAFDAVERGDIQQTVIMLPKEEIQLGIEALDLHFNGKDVPKFYDLTKESILPGTMNVEKSNIQQFKDKGLPEY